MSKEFKAKVTLEYDFKVIVGEDALTEEFMKEFREYMYDFYTVEQHVEHIAQYFARFGTVRGIEGYPYIIEDGLDSKYIKVQENVLKKSINVVRYRGDSVEVEVELEESE